jgi:hypothetical protein
MRGLAFYSHVESTCMTHLSLRGEVWAHQISIARHFFTEVPVPSQESELLCVRVSMLPLSTIFIFHFGIFSTMWYFFVFHVYYKIQFQGSTYTFSLDQHFFASYCHCYCLIRHILISVIELFLVPWNKTLKYLNYFLLGFYSKV